MKTIKSYNDLCSEIEIWEERLKTYDKQIKALERLGKINGPGEVSGVDYSRPSIITTTQISFEAAITKILEIQERAEGLKDIITQLKESQLKIKEQVEKLGGLDYKVVYMRDIEDKSLWEIADELELSYGYIKNISHRNPKKSHKGQE